MEGAHGVGAHRLAHGVGSKRELLTTTSLRASIDVHSTLALLIMNSPGSRWTLVGLGLLGVPRHQKASAGPSVDASCTTVVVHTLQRTY